MLDTTYPTTSFSPSLSANIAFSSLPEGDLPTAGAHSYSWRIPLPRGETLDKGVAEEEEGDGCLHGFVYFQTEKVRARRGGLGCFSIGFEADSKALYRTKHYDEVIYSVL